MWKIISVGQSVAVTLSNKTAVRKGRTYSGGDNDSLADNDSLTDASVLPSAPLPSEQPLDDSVTVQTTNTLVKQVSMQVPEPAREDDVDEKTGLSKHSLQFVLSNLHSKAITAAKKRRPSIQSTTETEVTGGDALSAALLTAAARASVSIDTSSSHNGNKERGEQQGGEGEDIDAEIVADNEVDGIEEIAVQLGIIILSSGDSFDSISKQQHTLPAYICGYRGFQSREAAALRSSNADMQNVLSNWKQLKVQAADQSTKSQAGDDDRSVKTFDENTPTFFAEVSVGNKFLTNGLPNSLYSFASNIEGSIIYSTAAGDATENGQQSDATTENIVACHIRLLSDGKLEIRLLKDLSPIPLPVAPLTNQSRQTTTLSSVHADDLSSVQSNLAAVGVSAQLLYQCRFTTKPSATAEREEDEVE